MMKILRQYKNLIAIAAVILIAVLFASDPFEFHAKRAYERAAIHNRAAVEKAEAEKQIAIINAEKDAAVRRIARGLELTEEMADESAGDTLSDRQ